ncbi:MAG: hypothetical protein IIC02_12655 [Planctomycetes bacterium]|nr:hypothetical protein [Planctomycetota bacterium]
MKNKALPQMVVCLGLIMLMLGTSCRSKDRTQEWIKWMESKPPEKRVKGFEQVKARMLRVPPQVGDEAPDFTLKTSDEKQSITLSKYFPDRPRVLIFASYT